MKLVTAFLVSWAIFLACSLVADQVPAGSPVWSSQVITKSGMVLLGLAAIRWLGPFDWSSAGFKRAENVAWTKVIGTGLLLGACTSIAIRASHSEGLAPILRGYSFLALVLVIWFGSSISEEILIRGWFQSYVENSTAHAAEFGAVLFASMHLGLLWKGVDRTAVAIIFLAALTLGYLAGKLREKSRSLAPAIAVHVAFNVGGVIGGIVSVVFEKLVLKGRI